DSNARVLVPLLHMACTLCSSDASQRTGLENALAQFLKPPERSDGGFFAIAALVADLLRCADAADAPSVWDANREVFLRSFVSHGRKLAALEGGDPSLAASLSSMNSNNNNRSGSGTTPGSGRRSRAPSIVV